VSQLAVDHDTALELVAENMVAHIAVERMVEEGSLQRKAVDTKPDGDTSS